MRAPRLARMVAVAAPRPDAEPVTIAHKPSPEPSFDIRIFLFDFKQPHSHARRGLPYRAADCPQIRQSSLRGINPVVTDTYAGLAGCPADIGACHAGGFSSSCSARNDRTRR